MVDEDVYCIDILAQISAATRAVEAVAISILDEHLNNCVVCAIAEGGNNATIGVRETSDAIAKLVRS